MRGPPAEPASLNREAIFRATGSVPADQRDTSVDSWCNSLVDMHLHIADGPCAAGGYIFRIPFLYSAVKRFQPFRGDNGCGKWPV